MKNLYVAVNLANLCDPYFLTSDVMQIQKDIWLFDISRVLSFWNHQCTFRKRTLGDLLGDLLHRVDENFLGVLAHHPWQALLKLQSLQQKNFTGLVNLLDRFNAKLYEEISFEIWIETFEHIRPYLNDKSLGAKIDLFKRSLGRLALKKISHLKNAENSNLKRRYGTSVAKVLRWTYETPKQDFSWDFFLDDFPWQYFKPAVTPEVKRQLDYYINSWGEISFILCADLDALAKSLQNKVLRLEWILILENMEEKSCIVDFRNPHCLTSELKLHDTSLRQFEFAFESFAKSFKDREDFLMISGWKIVASHFISNSFLTRDFFADQSATQVLKIENKLKSSLTQYSLTMDFAPDHCFEKLSSASSHDDNTPSESTGLRPLFIYQQPKEINAFTHNLLFTERVTTHWWEDDYQVRDYFLEKSEKPRWIFWDHISKKWFEHGLFG